MATCQPLVIGETPAPLTVILARGEPASLVIPIEGTLADPVVEWSVGAGPATVSHPLTLVGVDGDHDLWSLTLTADQVDELGLLRAVRVAQPFPRRVVAAGLIDWREAWSGECVTRTAPLRVVGLPGPPGDPGPPGAAIVATVDPADDGVLIVSGPLHVDNNALVFGGV